MQDSAELDVQTLALMQQRFDRGVSPADEPGQRKAQAEATQASLADVAAQVSTVLVTGQAEAGRDEVAANYQAAVLDALQDANTSLAQQRRAAGVSGQLDLPDARRNDIDASLKSLDGEATLLKDFVALHKSLGLGWQARG